MSVDHNTIHDPKKTQDAMRSGLNSAAASAQRFTDQVSQAYGITGEGREELTRQGAQNLEMVAQASAVLRSPARWQTRQARPSRLRRKRPTASPRAFQSSPQINPNESRGSTSALFCWLPCRGCRMCRKSPYGNALVMSRRDRHMGAIADLCFTGVSG
jgi:hypothetical protein